MEQERKEEIEKEGTVQQLLPLISKTPSMTGLCPEPTVENAFNSCSTVQQLPRTVKQSAGAEHHHPENGNPVSGVGRDSNRPPLELQPTSLPGVPGCEGSEVLISYGNKLI